MSSVFDPSANVQALLGGYRVGESAVHTGLALAHQRQSNILNAARMEHYNKLDEARSRRQDFLEDEQHKKEQAERDTNEALLAIHLDKMVRQHNQQEATRLADTGRTAMNLGQPVGGLMIGGNSVLAPEPAPGMGPGVDEGGSPPVGTDSVLAPPPAAAPDTALQTGPGAIAAGAPQTAAPQTDEYEELDNRYLPAFELARKTGNRVNVGAVLNRYNAEHAALDKRKANEALDKNRTANTAIRGREADSREERRTVQNHDDDARVDQGQQNTDIRRQGLTDKEQGAEDKKAAKEKGALALQRLKSGVSEAEGTKVADYAAARDAGYVNQERSPLTPQDKPGKIDPNEAKADAQVIEGIKAKIARLQRVSAALLVRDPKMANPESKAADAALAAAESELEDEHVKQAGKYSARQGMKAKEPPAPLAAAHSEPSQDDFNALKAANPGKSPEEIGALWRAQHQGG